MTRCPSAAAAYTSPISPCTETKSCSSSWSAPTSGFKAICCFSSMWRCLCASVQALQCNLIFPPLSIPSACAPGSAVSPRPSFPVFSRLILRSSPILSAVGRLSHGDRCFLPSTPDFLFRALPVCYSEMLFAIGTVVIFDLIFTSQAKETVLVTASSGLIIADMIYWEIGVIALEQAWSE